jgi:hypothetical protein
MSIGKGKESDSPPIYVWTGKSSMTDETSESSHFAASGNILPAGFTIFE